MVLYTTNAIFYNNCYFFIAKQFNISLFIKHITENSTKSYNITPSLGY